MGAYSTLLNELKMEDPSQYRSFLRMTTEDLDEILRIIGPTISKKETAMRSPISPKEKLAATLQFLATGI